MVYNSSRWGVKVQSDTLVWMPGDCDDSSSGPPARLGQSLGRRHCRSLRLLWPKSAGWTISYDKFFYSFPFMQMKKQNLFELSPAEVMIAPWWVRYILNTGKISFLALLGAIFFTIMAVIGGEGKYSWPMAGLIVCGAWLGLNFLLMHIGFLSYAAKNGDMGYLSRMLLCGPLFWGDYFNKVMKPRLAQSISEKKHPTMGKTKSKKIQETYDNRFIQ